MDSDTAKFLQFVFTLIMLVFYYSIGTQLERTWGTYRYNLYLFLGMIFTIAGSIILFLYCLLIGAQPLALGTETIYSLSNGIHVYFGSFSTYYINICPYSWHMRQPFRKCRFCLCLSSPIKVKWLGIVYGAMLVFECLTGVNGNLVCYRFFLTQFLLYSS